MKRRPRIDIVLRTPVAMELNERLKRAFAEASGHDPIGDRERHLAAAYEARSTILEMIALVRAEPGNEHLPMRPLYHYIINRAFHELTEPLATEEERQQVELTVYLPPGRPPGRKSYARQRVIDDLRAHPGLADSQVADRAIKYGAWEYGHSDAPADRRRRINRLRRDAAK